MDAAVKSVLLTVITLAATSCMEAVAVALEVVSIDYLGP
jgi:hypothetical protein